MGRFFVSIKPFIDDAGSGYATDFIDVTNDVTLRGIGKIRKVLDANEFDMGIFRHTSFTLRLVNFTGKYSEVGTVSTIFKSTRANSIVRVEWDITDRPRTVGFHPAGEFPPSKRQLLGDFLLNDDTMSNDAGEQSVKFKCLSTSTLFDQTIVDFANISNGDLYSEILFTVLNQTTITNVLTVTAGNLVPAVDSTIDDKTLGDLENKTVTQLLKKLLPYCNSILDIRDNVVFVSDRTPSAAIKFAFLSAGTETGTENIIDIKKFKSGISRIKNFVTVKDTAIKGENASSQSRHGVRRKEIEFAPVTSTAKRQAAVNSIVAEFGDPKVEFDIETPMQYDRLDLEMIDRVSVDFRLRVQPTEDGLPLYEIAQYDVARYPFEIGDIEIDTLKDYKIMASSIDTNTEMITFDVREI